MLTNAQVADAVRQMNSHCRLLMEQYNAGVAEYQSVTARGVLYTLGFEADADQILSAIGEAGFNYCLDRTVADHNGEYPTQDVCWWGADQLQSRLAFIDNRIERQS